MARPATPSQPPHDDAEMPSCSLRPVLTGRSLEYRVQAQVIGRGLTAASTGKNEMGPATPCRFSKMVMPSAGFGWNSCGLREGREGSSSGLRLLCVHLWALALVWTCEHSRNSPSEEEGMPPQSVACQRLRRPPGGRATRSVRWTASRRRGDTVWPIFAGKPCEDALRSCTEPVGGPSSTSLGDARNRQFCSGSTSTARGDGDRPPCTGKP